MNMNNKKKIIISDYFSKDYKINFNKLTTLVKHDINNIAQFELHNFIKDIEDKLNKLKEATGLYNIDTNEQMIRFQNDKFTPPMI